MQLKVNNQLIDIYNMYKVEQDAFLDNRDTYYITFHDQDHIQLYNLFANLTNWGIQYSNEQYVDYSEYSILGKFTDKLNGEIEICMCKKNDKEKSEHLISIVQPLFQILDDDQSLNIKEYFPAFQELVDRHEEVEQFFKFQYNNILWKTLQPSYIFDGVYIPGVGTESLFARVERDNKVQKIIQFNILEIWN